MRVLKNIGLLTLLLAAYQGPSNESKDNRVNDAIQLRNRIPAQPEIPTSSIVIYGVLSRHMVEGIDQFQKTGSAKDAHDWIDSLNAVSTSVIALFTILLFIGVVIQVRTSRDIERAWIMAELEWYPDGIRVSQEPDRPYNNTIASTRVRLKLTCRNDGRSPAWIYAIFAHSEIFPVAEIESQKITRGPHDKEYTRLTPIGPGSVECQQIDLECARHLTPSDYVNISVSIKYRDIFGRKRTTDLGYAVGAGGSLSRLFWITGRNKNT